MILRQGDFDYPFDIKEHSTSRLILERKEDNRILIFQKQNTKSTINIDKTVIPSFVNYKINTENNEFENIELCFFQYKELADSREL